MIDIYQIESTGIFFIKVHRKDERIPGMLGEVGRDQDLFFHRKIIDVINILSLAGNQLLLLKTILGFNKSLKI